MAIRLATHTRSRRAPRRARAAGAIVAAGALLTSTAIGATPASGATTSWGPVTTIWQHGFEDLGSVTTDTGMVVASWIGPDGRLWVATRRVGESWSGVTTLPASVAALTIVKDRNSAWLLGQNFDDVFVLQVHKDGHVGELTTIGTSADPFISDAEISIGANGAVAAAWHAGGTTAKIAYKPAGVQEWEPAESVPIRGDLHGLVVGSAGTAQLVVSKAQGDFRHQRISYLRRSPDGVWADPVTVATQAWLTSTAGNQHGDLVVGWQVDDADTYSVHARYRPAEGGFGPQELLATGVPYGTHVALGMADDGTAAAAYRIADSGDRQLSVSRADSDGTWSAPEELAMTGDTYDVAMNGAGDFVVVSSAGSGSQLVTCSPGAPCGAPETNPATGYRFPSASLAPGGIVTLLWGRGCKTEECQPTRLVAQRGR